MKIVFISVGYRIRRTYFKTPRQYIQELELSNKDPVLHGTSPRRKRFVVVVVVVF